MYKELIELCDKYNIDIEKAYVAKLCSDTLGINDPEFEKICDITYNQFQLEKDIESINV